MTHPRVTPTGLSRRAFSAGVAAAASLAVPTLRAQPAGRIVLGQSAAFSGAAAQLGIQFHAGAKLFFEQHNAQGAARRIEIEQMDDGYEPSRCAENTQKLLDREVFALFGYIGTPTSVVALPLATKADVPFIAPFTGAMSLRQPFNRMAFHLRASYNDETELIVKNLHNLGLTRVAVFYQNDAYGKAGLDGTLLALASRGLKPVATGTVERNTVDVAAAVATINAANPQAVVQISAYRSCAAYIRAARKAGYGGSFYNVSFVGTQALADELGKDGAGVVVSQVVPSPFSSAKPVTREFREAIAQDGNKVQANFSSLEGYLAARLVVEGLKRAGGRNGRDGLIAGLESLGETSFSGYSVALSARDHVASHFVEMSMLTGDGKVRT